MFLAEECSMLSSQSCSVITITTITTITDHHDHPTITTITTITAYFILIGEGWVQTNIYHHQHHQLTNLIAT
jgi:hypothetical protein